MPEQTTLKRARAAKRAGRAPSTQAGEFVREEMDHIREGKHGARSTKQAIAIGLSKARKAGVDLPAPKKGTTSERTRRAAKRALRQGRSGRKTISSSRSRATRDALKREGHAAASKKALARQARSSARKRSASSRRASARQAARTKGPALRRSAARACGGHASTPVGSLTKADRKRPGSSSAQDVLQGQPYWRAGRVAKQPVRGDVRRKKPAVKVTYSAPAPRR